jgi:uncharacterized protein YoaH (UPF0181 family)
VALSGTQWHSAAIAPVERFLRLMREAISMHSEAIAPVERFLRLMREAISMHSEAIAPVERFLRLRGRGHVASQHLQCGPKRLQRVERGHLGFARVHVGLTVPWSYLQVSEGGAVRCVPNLE